MKARNLLFTLVVSLSIITALVTFIHNDVVNAEDNADIDTTELSAKLDEVLANQKALQAELTAIKEELKVIKIRITQNQ